MAISIGQHAVVANASAAHPTSLTTASTTTAGSGSTFVIFAGVNGQTVSSVSDSFSNVYVLKANPAAFFFGSIFTYAYVCDNGSGGAGHTATANFSAGAAGAVFFVEILGGDSPIFDVAATVDNGNTAAASASGAAVTSNFAKELILSFFVVTNGGGSTISDALAWNSVLDLSNPLGTDASIFAGATSFQVETSTGTYSDTYALVPSNTSGGITLALKAPVGPHITLQPFNVYLAPEQLAVFQVTATTTGGSLTYQWQDNRSGSFANSTDGTGAASAIYSTGPLGFAAQGRLYQVLVTDSNGTVTSASASVTVLQNAQAATLLRKSHHQGGVTMDLTLPEWF